MSKSKIEWTESTWEVTGGCTACSKGCQECYAKNYIWRWAHKKSFGDKYQGLVEKKNGRLEWTGKIKLFEDALDQPLNRKKPTIYFIDSRSDLFHPKVEFEFIDKVLNVFSLCPQHTGQILTKRPEVMSEYFGAFDIRNLTTKRHHWPYPNVHLGVSICTPDEKPKMDILRQIPAAVNFISFEPLLADMGELDLSGIDGAIVGGESGSGARPMHPDWARNIRDQCVAANKPFFFKQWGAYTDKGPGRCVENDVVFLPDGTLMNVKDVFSQGCQKFYSTPTDCVWMKRVPKKKAGRLLDGREWNQWPKC